jgi:oligoribonuclease
MSDTLDPMNHLLLVDIETTGLDARDDLLLEVGLMIVTLDFKPVAMYSEIVRQPNVNWDDCSDVVQKMHLKSGLMKLIDGGAGEDLDDIEAGLIDWYEQLFGNEKVPLVGSSVHFDRGFFAENFVDFIDLVSYRNIDWSSVKELCRRYNPEVYEKLPPKSEKHRAIPDLQDTIGEARFYLDNFLIATRPEL